MRLSELALIKTSLNDWAKDMARKVGVIRVLEHFMYISENNKEWMNIFELQKWIEANKNKTGDT